MNWISVKDRLPKPGSRVLVYCAYMNYEPEDYTVEEGRFSPYDNKPDRWIMSDSDCCYDDSEVKVTHWMPWPEVPQ